MAFTSTELDRASVKPFAPNLTVAVFPTDKTLDAAIVELTDKARALLPSYRITSNEPGRLLGGEQTRLLTTAFDFAFYGPQQSLQLLTAKAGRVYLVTYISSAGGFPQARQIFQRSMASFALE